MEDQKHRTFSQKKKVNAGFEAAEAQTSLSETLFLGIKGQLLRLDQDQLKPGLYLVATPIGHLADITLRALAVLAKADKVACEDTRHSRKLLSAYGLRRKLETYHDFSDEKDRGRLLGFLAAGQSVALISDAGTPLIADPGYKLVRDALEKAYPVMAIPGPSATLSALISSGLPTDQFSFAGFLPPKEAGRRQSLKAASALPGTVIFYETSPRMRATLTAIAELMPERKVAIARELTKLHEEVMAGSPQELLERIGERELLGEMVILLGPRPAMLASKETIETALYQALKTQSVREAVGKVAEELGVQRKVVYNLALSLKGRSQK